jgi:Tol biopolymer transport system component/DNA-binding winged helix-turn-helix (wHTH) protein
MPQVGTSQVIRFATFEVDLQAQELRKAGLRMKLSAQPFQVLAVLLEQPGIVVTREELQKRLWPDTFVDVDHSLNTAINKIREALGDTSENPRFVETLPRRGYRFIGSITANGTAGAEPHSAEARSTSANELAKRRKAPLALALSSIAVLLVSGGLWIYKRNESPVAPPQHTLTRITFDEGLQNEPTWSPDGRYIAYSSDRAGKFDIWVQQIGGGNPLQITNRPGNNWQPDWSPDGKSIAYRSEDGEGGLYVAPAIGGAGLEKKIASFGYYPRWSPDATQILFRTHLMIIGSHDHFYVVDANGGQPREVLADVIPERDFHTDSAAWHPDGKRVSVLLWNPSPSPVFWTVPLSGGSAVKSEISSEASKRFAEASVAGAIEVIGATKFSWAPSGDAIYFDRIYRGTRNLWKMTIDPPTLRGIHAERLTVGAGYDVQPAISPDGGKLAFTTQTRHVRTWVFPFDATLGHMTGSGKPVTSPGLEAWAPNLSRDGSKLIFQRSQNGGESIWEKSLPDGAEIPIFTDRYVRDLPQWSPDGRQIAYGRHDIQTGEGQICVWSNHAREEITITSRTNLDQVVYDWFPDGKSVLATVEASDTHLREVWQLQVPPVGSQRVPANRKLISDPNHELYQPHISPDGRWIVFEAFKNSAPVGSDIYVTPTEGGPLTRISQGSYWDDKPRWSPDGKIIYYVSGRNTMFNVWGVHFDASKGRPVGQPFRVTSFDSPGLRVGDNISAVDFSLVRDKFALTMEDRVGNIWMLEHIDH